MTIPADRCDAPACSGILVSVQLKDIDLAPAILDAARAGEPAALAAFYRACARPAYALVRRIVRGPAADDVLQDAFIDAIRGLRGYDGRAPLGIWFRSVVVRRCFMHLRSPWQRSRDALDGLLDSLEGERDVGVRAGQGIDLERAFARLAPLTRLVVWLHDVEGYTHEEIAAATGRTASFSKSQLARGHARLRGWLEPAHEEVTDPCPPAIPE